MAKLLVGASFLLSSVRVSAHQVAERTWSIGGWIKAAAERRDNWFSRELRLRHIFAESGRDLLQQSTHGLPGCVNLNAASVLLRSNNWRIHTPLSRFLVNTSNSSKVWSAIGGSVLKHLEWGSKNMP